MTDTVVVDTSTTVVVDSANHNTVVNTVNIPQIIYTGIMGPPGAAAALSLLSDVNSSSLNSGSILVYDTVTEKWISTTLLNQQIVDSGQY